MIYIQSWEKCNFINYKLMLSVMLSLPHIEPFMFREGAGPLTLDECVVWFPGKQYT